MGHMKVCSETNFCLPVQIQNKSLPFTFYFRKSQFDTDTLSLDFRNVYLPTASSYF